MSVERTIAIKALTTCSATCGGDDSEYAKVMVCVIKSGRGDKPFGGPLGSEKNEWETSLDNKSSEVIKMGTLVVCGFAIAKRSGSNISLGWRYSSRSA
ncbi:MAG: hypothetical protein EOP04_17290 [Proteobacteria bacterium]|nr:MAG: hypothetical protein EOP04_17290 [Pseudomonadota bacterium]